MRRMAPRPFANALDRVAADLAPMTPLARVQAAWPEVAGPVMGAEAEPVAERAGEVTLRCGSSVWAQELELLSADLLERLNATLGGPLVKRLRFVAGGRREGR